MARGIQVTSPTGLSSSTRFISREAEFLMMICMYLLNNDI